METQRIVFSLPYLFFYLPICSCQRTLAWRLPGIQEALTPLPFHCPAKLISTDPQRNLVGETGFEPVTLRLSSACSNQLSYTPNKVGGAEESRTPDL